MRAPVRANLLSHQSERLFVPEAHQIREYSVGMEVFRRRASFDRDSDSIVRVEANWLRYCLFIDMNAVGQQLMNGFNKAEKIKAAPPDDLDPSEKSQAQGTVSIQECHSRSANAGAFHDSERKTFDSPHFSIVKRNWPHVRILDWSKPLKTV